jgi:hypothetical protein
MIEVFPLGREDSGQNNRSLERIETQQARVRQKLDRLGGELKPVRSARSRPAPENVWAIPSLNRNLRVEVKAAATECADFAARGVVHALESCGFTARTVKDASSTWESVHVESRAEQAAAALLIQGAFRAAGIGAGLTIHDRAAAKRIVVHVGPCGLS